MTKPDAAPEVLELVDLVLRTAGDLSRLGDQIAGAHGHSAARSLILGALADGPATIADVARRRGLRRQSVQETMQRLEREGLVARVPESSRRSPEFQLTQGGRSLQRSLHSAFRDWATKTAPKLDRDALAATVVTLRSLRDRTPDGEVRSEHAQRATIPGPASRARFEEES